MKIFYYYQHLISTIEHNFWLSLKKYVGEVKSHLKFLKFKVALNPTYSILNLPKIVPYCALLCLSNVDNIENFQRAVFQLQAFKAVIKGVFSRLCCCYGNLLWYKNDGFTNGGALF